MFENENVTQNFETNVIQSGKTLSEYVSSVFMWMFAGLLLTALTAYGVAVSGLAILFVNPVSIIILGIAELALVIILTSRIRNNSISVNASRIVFLMYAVLNGLTLSVIFLVYALTLIYQAFFVAALTFGTMAVVGYTTKKDLTKFGSLLIMGLIGIIIVTLVNYIFGMFGMFSSQLDTVISYVAVFVFLGLTAWDMQKIKAHYYASAGNESVAGNLAIVSALALYLDFINLLLYIIKILARRRN